MRDASHRSRHHFRVLLTFAVVLIVTLAAMRSGSAQTDTGRTAPHPGKAAGVADPPLIDLAGYRQLLAKYKGKPLVVNFWATWCEPCRDEYPMIVELAKEFKPEGVSVVGVDMDDESDMNLVRRFIARTQPLFPNYRQKPGIDPGCFLRRRKSGVEKHHATDNFLRARRADHGIFSGHAAAVCFRAGVSRDAWPRKYAGARADTVGAVIRKASTNLYS